MHRESLPQDTAPSADEQAQLEQFARRYGPKTQPQSENAPEPAPAPSGDTSAITPASGQGTAQEAVLGAPALSAPAPSDDDTLLREMAKGYFVHERPEIGLRLWGYADQQRRLREAGTFYRTLLQHPQLDEGIRRGALAGLGSLLMQAGQADAALTVLQPYLPLTVREQVEKTSSTTRNILLEQMERGEPSHIGSANQETQARRKARR